MKHSKAAAIVLILGGAYLFRVAVAQRSVSTAVPGGAGGQDHRLVAYPDRPKAAQEVLDRGKAVYGVNCAFCHGSDAGGGEIGPNLLRSSVVLNDQNGELIMPIVHGARSDKGMPAIPINDAQVQDVAAWLHSLKVASRTDPNENNLNIVTGDAHAGQADFERVCASCHSATGDLKGIGSRFATPKMLQQDWMLPGGAGGRGPAGPAPKEAGMHLSPTTVTVTQPDGKSVTGVLDRLDDFYVGLREENGTNIGFARDGDVPRVVLHDSLAPHRELLHTYTDKEIHDLTAYLVTLK